MTGIDRLLIALLALWLALSVIAQFSTLRAARLLRRFDLFGVIPGWTLFAPRPSVSDYHVLWRPLTSTGDALGRWVELRSVPRNLWLGGFWNPGRREYKALMDVLAWLNTEMARAPESDAAAQVPYRLLLNHVAWRVPAEVERFQFTVLKIDRRTDPATSRPLVTSRAHHVRDAR